MAHWGPWQSRPLEERIIPASGAILEFIQEDNIKNEILNRPARPGYQESLWNDVRHAVSSLPEKIKHLVSKKLAAIVLVEELGSTGFSDILRDEKGHASAGFIVLDVHAIDRKANDWASWKENSPFAEDKGVTLKAVIEEPDHNTRMATIQYILLHEIGHVLAIGKSYHPSWDEDPKSADALKPYAFASASWKVNPKTLNYENPGLSDCHPIRYYNSKSNLSRLKAEACYRELERSSFVSLYASTNPFDDFAETFAFYVHRVLLDKPWHLEISGSSKVYRYEPRWTDERFKQKRVIIEAML